MTVLLVALGGALGAVARHLLIATIVRFAPPGVPLGTFAVNGLGCLVFGIVAGAASARWWGGTDGRVFLLVGVLGGFTTFSTFAFENVVLLRDGRWGLAAANAVGQVVIGSAAVWLGARLTG